MTLQLRVYDIDLTLVDITRKDEFDDRCNDNVYYNFKYCVDTVVR